MSKQTIKFLARCLSFSLPPPLFLASILAAASSIATLPLLHKIATWQGPLFWAERLATLHFAVTLGAWVVWGVGCMRKGACPRTSFLTHFFLPQLNASQAQCRPFAIVCSKWQTPPLAAFSFSFRLHCNEVVLSQVGLPPPQPFGLQGAGRKKRDCKKRQATATTTINHHPLLPFCQTPGSESQ